jgi:hypothetical protein
MLPNSSTTNSEPSRPAAAAPALFVWKVALFTAPYLMLGAFAWTFVMRSGELESVDRVAQRQADGRPFIYGAAFSDRAYRLKVEAARRIRPDVLALGPSRMNQWRSAMFAPLRFYNAGNCVYVQRDFRRVLEDLGDPLPRIVLFSIDYYTFDPAWDTWFEYVSREDVPKWGTAGHSAILRRLGEAVSKEPRLLLARAREPIYGQSAIGLRAIQLGNGFRIDGSFQYGTALTQSEPPDTVESVLGRIRRSEPPFMASAVLDDERRDELKRFVELAHSRRIKLVGITMPYAPEVVQALNRSASHGAWKQFQDPQFATWLEQLGVVYFNFTNLETFGGRAEEFVDPFHPSEAAYVRMLLTMLGDARFQELVPAVRASALRDRLRAGSLIEVFRNDF